MSLQELNTKIEHLNIELEVLINLEDSTDFFQTASQQTQERHCYEITKLEELITAYTEIKQKT